jgi:hypothetical protein
MLALILDLHKKNVRSTSTNNSFEDALCHEPLTLMAFVELKLSFSIKFTP